MAHLQIELAGLQKDLKHIVAQRVGLEEKSQGGIAPEVVWLFPSPDNPETCVGAECRPDPVCLVGLENCGTGVQNRPVRTYWLQRERP